MPTYDFRLKELLTLWYSRKWSRIIGLIMFIATFGDIVFTLLNVAKYGIDLEINPIAKSLIGAGEPLTLLWIVLNILSALLIYLPLISLYLMMPTEKRLGIASTLISALLASRIAIVIYGIAVFHYSAGETLASVVVVGVTVMFSIRYTMRHGDSVSLDSIRMALVNLWTSFRDSVTGFFSALAAHPSVSYRTRKQRRTDDKKLPKDIEEREGGKPRVGTEMVPGRRNRRIMIIIASLIATPIAFLLVMQFIKDMSGIEGLTRTIITIGGGTQGSLFLVGFILTLVTVAVMVYLLLALFDEITREKPKV